MKKKNALWMLAAILFCGLTAGVLSACGDDDKADEKQDSMEAMCHVLVSEDVLKVADVTVHYLDAKGQQASERMTTTEWKKTWKTTTLPARIGVWPQLTPKTDAASSQDSYQLKVVATAGYLFHAAEGGDWANGWVNVKDPNAEPENVAAADVQKWCNRGTTVGCKIDAEGMGEPVVVDFGGNDGEEGEHEPYNGFCIWLVSLFGLGPDYCT